jgi:hypothetical protein
MQLPVVHEALGPRIQFDESFADGKYCSLCAVVDLQLMEDVADVVLHRLLAEIEAVGDLFVGLSIRHETQHGNLAFR